MKKEGNIVEIVVYVDVLLVLNYIVSLLLVLCMCKLSGRIPKRRRVVAAALIGCAGSLTIFLPYLGFWFSIFSKAGISILMVLAACKYINIKTLLKEWFVFFAVNFFFAGVMLGIWMLFVPQGMIYHNGIVYFDTSTVTLLVATSAAYLCLSLANRFARAGRIRQDIYRARIHYREKAVEVYGLVDTGNSLYEPFSGAPVIICTLQDLEPVLPHSLVEDICQQSFPDGTRSAVQLRLIPFSNVGKTGVLPAFRPDYIELLEAGGTKRVENVFIGISRQKLGDGRYSAILNPDLLGKEVARSGI